MGASGTFITLEIWMPYLRYRYSRQRTEQYIGIYLKETRYPIAMVAIILVLTDIYICGPYIVTPGHYSGEPPGDQSVTA